MRGITAQPETAPLKLGENEIENAAFVSVLPRNATPSVRHFWRRQFPAIRANINVLDL